MLSAMEEIFAKNNLSDLFEIVGFRKIDALLKILQYYFDLRVPIY